MTHLPPETLTNALLLSVIGEQRLQIALLEECCRDFEKKVRKNSQNSSKQPSSDGYQKPDKEAQQELVSPENPDSQDSPETPNPKSLRQSSGNKAGGQKGHKGHMRKKVKHTKAYNLFRRLLDFKEETLRFMSDFSIPFDNNGSERDARMTKLKQKISGCFRNDDGGFWSSRIRSYLSSAKKQGMNIFNALLIVVQNYSNKLLPGAE